jgi:uncharacterized Zn-binding protein involved in type VI secretion
MQPQSRLGDNSQVPAEDHHNARDVCIGPAETGWPDVKVNSRPALRVSDTGVHSQCCDANTWVAVAGSQTVLVNNLEAHKIYHAGASRGHSRPAHEHLLLR